jgi:hypothetical protein
VEGSVWPQWADQHDGSFGSLRKLGESNHWADREVWGERSAKGPKTSTNEKLTIATLAFEGFRVPILRHRTIQELHRGIAPPARRAAAAQR